MWTGQPVYYRAQKALAIYPSDDAAASLEKFDVFAGYFSPITTVNCREAPS
jgi:hypothetical protein